MWADSVQLFALLEQKKASQVTPGSTCPHADSGTWLGEPLSGRLKIFLVTNPRSGCHHHLQEISLFLFPPRFPFEPLMIRCVQQVLL